MSDIQRTESLSGLIFGSTASTTIPASPAIGTSYRNTNLTKETASSGWPFAKIVDSADFNEIMYKITSVLDAIEVQGILFWADVTDYVAGSIVRRTSGTTEKFYEALAPSGPNSGGAQDPAILENIGTYWKEASIGGGGGSGGYAVQFVSTNTNLEKGNLYFCTAGGIQLSLPTLGLLNGDKIKIATGRTVGIGTTVIISGSIEAKDGSTDSSLVIDTPYSSVELVYDINSQIWKVCSPIARGTYTMSSVPVGTVIAYAANLAPAGFFICDGSAKSRTEYSQLFSVIGTIYGAGDGSTTFNLPDFRGKFLRGYGVGGMEGIGNLTEGDNGGFSGEFGVEQKEQLPDIKGRIFLNTAGKFYDGDAFESTSESGKSGPSVGSWGTGCFIGNFAASNASVVYKENGHNAPANFAVNFIIKY